jgi:hypothetical protein
MMTNPCDKKTSNNTLSMYMAIGSGIGSALRVTLVVVFDILHFSLGVGMAICAGLGLAIGSAFQVKKKQ